MAHIPGDVVEVTYRGSCEGQAILNIWHYAVIASSSTSSDIADNASLSGYLAAQTGPGQLTKLWLDVLPTNYDLEYIRAQKVYPIRSQFTQEPVNILGFWGVVSNNTNLAAVITKQGQTGTRHAIGAIHVGPVAENAHERGKLTAVYQTAMNSLRSTWSASFTNPANNVQYRPCIYNPGVNPAFQLLSGTLLQNTLRTMRRRTVGQGI